MKQKVKELRVQIDGLGQLCKELEPLDNCIILDDRIGINKNSIQINKATDSLFLAKAWLGKVLGELGEESPYPKDGTRKTVEDIEPTADQARVENESESLYYKKRAIAGMNHIEKVDWLRQSIQEIIKKGEEDIENSSVREEYIQTSLIWYWFESKKQLMVARFQLGFELERVRNDSNI